MIRLFQTTAAALIIASIILAIAAATPKAEVKTTPPYCVDPFASADLGTVIYTHCTNVPMWSIKV